MRQARAHWLIVAAVLTALSGCGPSRGQVLFYELELAVASFGLACFLMWLGRVLFDSRIWFVCSYCLKTTARHDVRDGGMTTCEHCGASTSVNELPCDLVREVARERGPRRLRLVARTRRGRLLVTLLLAIGFQAALIAAGYAVVVVAQPGNWPGFDGHRWWHEVAFPFVFTLGCGANAPPWPWWGLNWDLLISYHLGASMGRGIEGVVGWSSASPTAFSEVLGVTFVQIGLWWGLILLGYRLRIRWWVVPGLVAGLNVLVAVTAYVAEWNL